MPTTYPETPDLVTVIREFLEADILPHVKDEKWFNVKVATNLLGQIERDLREGAALDRAEEARLAHFVGPDGTLADKTQRLSEAIRSGRLTWRDKDLVEHLRQTCAEALAVNNPKWLEG